MSGSDHILTQGLSHIGPCLNGVYFWQFEDIKTKYPLIAKFFCWTRDGLLQKTSKDGGKKKQKLHEQMKPVIFSV